MLRRLILALLAIGLILPALAAPVHAVAQSGTDAAIEAGMDHAHHGQAPDTPDQTGAAKHECIGCIAPFHVASGPDALVELRSPATSHAIARELHPHVALPEPPPPRP